ncbi:ATP-binding cassette, subfamily B [Austwickia chelonae]|uniref:Putative ABC transporter permease/ATP-binding protein n=1 Tax=Austwickia chelonae NBRC 105200 TaxID=1184607 RepID=K6V8M2_9MICO|nr:ABC transporter ATP-binding protein [Austwickia chelonae]GAB78553.1 putative ABC transporter permease/ATP-binding protein [Austwickia chelonae NBRC 105200]SEW40727.1 ATP-binding cassette, subfamily B [Austwickia chelonae]
MLTSVLTTHLRPYRRYLTAVVVLQLVGTIASLFLPSLNADIIDHGVAKGDTGHIWRVAAVMLAACLVQAACQIGAVWNGARAAMGMGRDLRALLFARVMSFSSQEVDRFGAHSLITRTTNDVQQLQQLVVMGCVILVSAPIMMIGGIVMALQEDVSLSWLVAVAVPALALAILLVVRRMIPLFRAMQTRIDAVNRVLREQITGIRVVRAFVREDHERERFATANDELTAVGSGVGRLMALMFPIVMLIMNLSTTAVIWFGGHRVDTGDMQVGALFAYMAYLIQILMSVMMATMVATMVPRASVSADRIAEVLATSTSVVAPEQPVTTVRSGVVTLDDVEFTYPGADAPVLRRITFTARPGTTTAVIGSTGAGKSTLINLLPRLFDVTGGQVRIDGIDVRDLDPDDLWSRIAVVPQRPYLFSGTVASNLRYGNPDATDDELWEALRIAQAEDFVRRLDGGLDAEIAQGGTNVSGGQRQRLCIARALVARPTIYLFDDSFSALDLATDARLRAALAPSTAQSTVLIVAQRVSTIVDADQIVVLDAGQIVGLGRHDDLLTTCPTYAEIVRSQLSAEEAA